MGLLAATACDNAVLGNGTPDSGSVAAAGAGGAFVGAAGADGGVETGAGSGGASGASSTTTWSHALGEDMEPQTVAAVAVDASGNVFATGHISGAVEIGPDQYSNPAKPLEPFSQGLFIAELQRTGAQPYGAATWVKEFDDPGAAGESIVLDASGNVLVAGHYSGTLDLGGGPMIANGRSTFVAKFNASGDCVWSRSIGADDCSSDAARLTEDDAGNIYVATGLCGTVDDLGTSPIASQGSADIVVAKLSGADGGVAWAGAVGGSAEDNLGGLGFDGTDLYLVGNTDSDDFRAGPGSQGPGRIFTLVWPASGPPDLSTGVLSRYGDGSAGTARVAPRGKSGMMMTGSFSGTLDFGQGPMTSAGGSDLYVARITSSGPVWSKRFGDSADQEPGAIASDGASGCIIAGALQGSVDWGCGGIHTAGGSDVFVTHLDSSGSCIYSQHWGGAEDQKGWSVAADGQHVAVGGSFHGTLAPYLLSHDAPSTQPGDGFILDLDKPLATDPTWGTRIGDSLVPQQGVSVAADKNDNVVAAGTVEGFIHWPGDPQRLMSHGKSDALLVKYDTAGHRLWAKDFGGPGYDYASGLALDPAGNIVLTGTFANTIDFGGGPMTASTSVPPDIFVAKLDQSGNGLWQKDFPSTSMSSYSSASIVLPPAVDAQGNVALAGTFGETNSSTPGTIDFGGGELKGKGHNDIFLAKLDAAGHHVWSKSFGFANAVDAAQSVVFDPSGAVILSGAFEESIDFGGGLLAGAGGWDLFLAKFGPDGQPLWSRHFSPQSQSAPMSMLSAVDSSGNVVVTGTFTGTLDFGGKTVTTPVPDALFVAKLDGGGKLQWVHAYDDATGTAISTDPQGNVLVAGAFRGNLDLGSGHVLTNAQNPQIFVSKFDPQGHVLAASAYLHTGYLDDDPYAGFLDAFYSANAINSESDGAVLLTGVFDGTVDFGSGALASAGQGASPDMFVSKMRLP